MYVCIGVCAFCIFAYEKCTCMEWIFSLMFIHFICTMCWQFDIFHSLTGLFQMKVGNCLLPETKYRMFPFMHQEHVIQTPLVFYTKGFFVAEFALNSKTCLYFLGQILPLCYAYITYYSLIVTYVNSFILL